jgi:hypothetical protein
VLERATRWQRNVLMSAAVAMLAASCTAVAPLSRSPETPDAPEISPTTTPDLDRASLPPHFVEAGGGWLTCERGFTLRDHRCVADAEVPHGATIEVSNLPSAGEGSRQPRACPSGGCSSTSLPPFLLQALSGAGGLDLAGAIDGELPGGLYQLLDRLPDGGSPFSR